MDKVRRVIFTIIVVFILASVAMCFVSYNHEKGSGNYVTYKCDVKNLRLSTDIEISKDGNYVKKIKGNVFKIVTDPLTLYDSAGNKLGYASDEYALIDQDSHMLRQGNTFYIMDGKFKLYGDKYLLYDEENNYIGSCEFNFINTKGKIKNANDEVIANYTSPYIYKDFDVTIYENCELDDDAILMICASYYSDKFYDASSGE